MAAAASRLVRANAAQLEVYRRLKNGGSQIVRVEHVHVNSGGQAVIGNSIGTPKPRPRGGHCDDGVEAAVGPTGEQVSRPVGGTARNAEPPVCRRKGLELSEPLKTNDRCILVEGPRWGDAEFYGKWLLAAARADVLMKKALNDPVFGKQIDRVSVTYVPDFCWTATFLLMQLQENLVSFAVDADSETSELFLHG